MERPKYNIFTTGTTTYSDEMKRLLSSNSASIYSHNSPKMNRYIPIAILFFTSLFIGHQVEAQRTPTDDGDFVFSATQAHRTVTDRLSDGTFITAYKTSSATGSDILAVVGTYSGGTISGYGTIATVETSATATDNRLAIVGLSATKAVLFYSENAVTTLKYRVLDIDISTGAITVNAEADLGDGEDLEWLQSLNATALTSDQVVVTYERNAADLVAVAGTVSGSTITWGTTVVVDAGENSYTDITRVSSNTFAIVYEDDDAVPDAGNIVAGTVSGNAITLGTPQVFEGTDQVDVVAITALSDTEVVVAFENVTNSNAEIFYATLAGTVFSFPGTPATFESGTSVQDIYMKALSATEVFVVTHNTGGPEGAFYTGLLSGNDITIAGTGTTFLSGGNADDARIAVLNSDVVVVSYTDEDNINLAGADFGSSQLFEYTATNNPEINVQGNSTDIVSGDNTPAAGDHTDFGTGAALSRTFTIQNQGTGTLTLGASAVTITGTNAADFSVNTQPATSVAGSGSTTFIIDFASAVASTRSAQIHINSDDLHEYEYIFDIQAVGAAACAAPTAQATTAVFGTETTTTLDLTSWTAPAGGATGYAVYINDANSFTAPADGAEPTGDLSWNAAGQQPIYFGTSASPALTVTGLAASTTYFFQVYAYNDCSGTETYETTGLNASDLTATPAPPPTISSVVVSGDNTYADITFSVGVYNTNGGSGALEVADFSPSLTGGTAITPVISAVRQNDGVTAGAATALAGGETVIRAFFSFTNTADGAEVLEFDLADGASVFEVGGTAAVADQTTTNTDNLQDETSPTVTNILRNTPSAEFTNADVVLFYVDFSETVTGVSASDFSITGTAAGDGTIGTIADIDGDTWSVQITGLTSSNGTIGLDPVTGQTLTDAAANGLVSATVSGTEESYTIDNTSPTVTNILRNTPSAEFTNADVVVFHVDFSESVSSVSASDFTITGTAAGDGTIGTIADIDGDTWSIQITGLTSSNGTIGLDPVTGQTLTDAATNGLVSAVVSGTEESYTIDNTAPADPAGLDLDAASDFGISNTDDLTNDDTPTINGTKEANTSIEVFSDQDGSLGTVTLDASTSWSFTSGALSENTHAITVVATDAAGNTSSTVGGLTIVIDVTDPTINNITSLDDGDGDVDEVEIEFSEDIVDADFTDLSDWLVTLGGTDAVTTFSSTVDDIVPTDADSNDEYVTLSFAPTNVTGTGTANYTYTNDGGDDIRDHAGNVLQDISSTAATDGADPVLLAASSTPLDGATGVAINTNVVLTFSETVQGGTGNVELIDVTNGIDTRTIAIGDGQLSFATNQLIINPTLDLQNNINYAVNVDATAIDDNASPVNSYAGIGDNVTMDFTTVGVIPTYTVTWLDDGDGDIDQAQIDFNVPVSVTDNTPGDAFDAFAFTGITIDNVVGFLANDDFSTISGVTQIVLNVSGVTGTASPSTTITYEQSSDEEIRADDASLFEIANTENPTAVIDGAAPVMISQTLEPTSNNYLEIVFSEGLFTSGGAALSDVGGEFSISFLANGGTATNTVIAEYTQADNSTPTGADDSTIRFQLTTSGFPDGNETIEITPTNGTSVYDGASPRNAMSAAETLGPVNLNPISASDAVTYVVGLPSTDNSFFVVEFSRDVDEDPDIPDFNAPEIQTSGGSPEFRTQNFMANGGATMGNVGGQTMTNPAGGAQTTGTFWRFSSGSISGTPRGVETFEIYTRDDTEVYGSAAPALAIPSALTLEITLADEFGEDFSNATGTAYDVDGDGNIDEVEIVMPDGVDDSTIEPGDFRLDPGGQNADGQTFDTGTTANDNTFTIGFTSYTGTQVSDIDYAASRSGSSSMTDDAEFYTYEGVTAYNGTRGNVIVDGSFTPVDAAGPVVVSASIYDTDATANGKIDELVVLFSEPISDQGVGLGDFVLDGGGYTASAFAVNANDVTLTLNEIAGAGVYDTDVQFEVEISPGIVDDAAGALNPDQTGGNSVTTTDEAAPYVEVNIVGSTGDGTPDLSGVVDDPLATVLVAVGPDVLFATNNGDGTWDLPGSSLSGPLGLGTHQVVLTTFDIYANVGTDAQTNEITVTGGVVITPAAEVVDICIGTEVALSTITLDETNNTDFSSTGTFTLSLPPGFEFSAPIGSVSVANTNGSGNITIGTVEYAGTSGLSIQLIDDGNDDEDDVITIAGLTVVAVGSTARSNEVIALGGTVGMLTGQTEIGDLSSQAQPAAFTDLDEGVHGSSNITSLSIRENIGYSLDAGVVTAEWRVNSAMVAPSVIGQFLTNGDISAPGLHTLYVADDNGMCEGDDLVFDLLIYNDDDMVNNPAIDSSFVDRTLSVNAAVDTIYLSNPAGHTASISGTGVTVVDPMANPLVAYFDPSFAGVGDHELEYEVVNNTTMRSVTISVTYMVIPETEFFTPNLNNHCINEFPFDVTVDVAQVTTPATQTFHIYMSDYTDGSPTQFQDLYLPYSELAAQPTPFDLADFDPTTWSSLITGNGGFSGGDLQVDPGEAVAIFVERYFFDNLTFDNVIEQDVIQVYGPPTVSLTNVDTDYCNEDAPFTIQRSADYVAQLIAQDPDDPYSFWNADYANSSGSITNGYLLIYDDNPVFSSPDSLNFTGSMIGTQASLGVRNVFDPDDPNNNSDFAEDESGYYRIVYYTEDNLTPVSCVGETFVDFFLNPVPAMPTLDATTLANGGAVGFVNTDEYLLEYCVNDDINAGNIYGQQAFVAAEGLSADNINYYTIDGTDTTFLGADGPNGMPYFVVMTVTGGNTLGIDENVEFYMSQVVAGCESPFRKITVQVYPTPDNPVPDVTSWPAAVISDPNYFLDYCVDNAGFGNTDDLLMPALTAGEQTYSVQTFMVDYFGTNVNYVELSSRSGVFIEGEIINAAPSLAQARVRFNGFNDLLIEPISGTITTSDIITGATSSATANVDLNEAERVYDANGTSQVSIETYRFRHTTRIFGGLSVGAFQPGETVVGLTTGAQAIAVYEPNTTNLLLRHVSGEFRNGETARGLTSNALKSVTAYYNLSPYFRYAIRETANINPASNFDGCIGDITYAYNFSRLQPTDPTELDLLAGTLDFHLAEGDALQDIVHSNLGMDYYRWYSAWTNSVTNTPFSGDSLRSGEAMTQTILNTAIGFDPSSVAVPRVNDAYTAFFTRTDNEIQSREFDGCESDDVATVNITVHAIQAQPTVVSDNAAQGIANFTDLNSDADGSNDDPGVDYYYSVCTDQVFGDLEFDADETTYTGHDTNDRVFRWYEYDNFAPARGDLVFTGKEADWVSLKIGSINFATSRYFEVIQVTDTLGVNGSTFAGTESESTLIRVDFSPQDDLTFDIWDDADGDRDPEAGEFIENLAGGELRVYCVDDDDLFIRLFASGADAITGDFGATYNGGMDETGEDTVSYEITSWLTTDTSPGAETNVQGALFPAGSPAWGHVAMDISQWHIDAGGDADLVGGPSTYHQIEMSYTDPTTNCTGYDVFYVQINPRPDITFFVDGADSSDPDFNDDLGTDYDEFCYDYGDVLLEGFAANLSSLLNPSGGQYLIIAENVLADPMDDDTTIVVATNNKAVFNTIANHGGDPYANQSSYQIRFDYTDENGCSHFVQEQIRVNPLPEVNTTLDGNGDASPDEVRLINICDDGGSLTAEIQLIDPVDPAGTAVLADYTGYQFQWSINGGLGALVNNTNTFTFAVPTTDFSIDVTVVDPNGCSILIEEDHSKQSLPDLDFELRDGGNAPISFQMCTDDSFLSGDASLLTPVIAVIDNNTDLASPGADVSVANVQSWTVTSRNLVNATSTTTNSSSAGNLPALNLETLHVNGGGNAFVDVDGVGGVDYSVGGVITYHDITITYQDSELDYQGIATACENTIVKTITVYPSPDITFNVAGQDALATDFNDDVGTDYDEFCYDHGGIILQGLFSDGSGLDNPGGGQFVVVVGVDDDFSAETDDVDLTTFNNQTIFDTQFWHDFANGSPANPEYADQAAHLIQFEYQDAQGCQHFVEQTIFTNPLPEASPTVDGNGDTFGDIIRFTQICNDNSLNVDMSLVLQTPAGADILNYTNYNFTWSINGATGVAVPNDNTFSLSLPNVTDISVEVDVVDPNGCTNYFFEFHSKQELPALDYPEISDMESFCVDQGVVDLTLDDYTGGLAAASDANVSYWRVFSYDTDRPDTVTVAVDTLSASVTRIDFDDDGASFPRIDFLGSDGAGVYSAGIQGWHELAGGNAPEDYLGTGDIRVVGGNSTVHTIFITYQDPTRTYQGLNTLCEATYSETIIMNPNPAVTFEVEGVDGLDHGITDADFTDHDEFCYDHGNVQLSGVFANGGGLNNPSGGQFVIVVGADDDFSAETDDILLSTFNNIAQFNTQTEMDNFHSTSLNPEFELQTSFLVQFEYQDVQGCTHFVEQTIYVNPLPDISYTVDGNGDTNPDAIRFTQICDDPALNTEFNVVLIDPADPTGLVELTDYTNYSFTWSVNGSSDVTVNDDNTYFVNVATPNLSIDLTITDPNGCTFSVNEQHAKEPLPVLDIPELVMDKQQFCADGTGNPPVLTVEDSNSETGTITIDPSNVLSWNVYSIETDVLDTVTYVDAAWAHVTTDNGAGTIPQIDIMAWHTSALDATGAPASNFFDGMKFVGGDFSVHTIEIVYQDPTRDYQGVSTLCEQTYYETIVITPAPDISFTVAKPGFVNPPDIVADAADFVGNVGSTVNVTAAADHYCYDDDLIDLTGVFGADIIAAYTLDFGSGSFTTPVPNAVVSNGNNRALFNPEVAHGVDPYAPRSSHLITYDYTDEFGCSNSITTTLYVNPRPEPENHVDNGLIQFDVLCQGDPKTARVVILDDMGVEVIDYSNYTFDWQLPVSASNDTYLDNSVTFDEDNLIFTIGVTVTNDLTGCSEFMQESETQGFRPEPSFTYVGITEGAPGGLDVYIHEDNPALQVDDVDQGINYMEFNLYDNPGLMGAPVFGRTYDTDPLTIAIPDLPVIFDDDDPNPTFTDAPSIEIMGLTAGEYHVELIMGTLKGCLIPDSTRIITILPVVSVADPDLGGQYQEGFNGGNAGGWYIERASEDGKNDTTRISSWELVGSPGVNFNPGPVAAAHLDLTATAEGDGMFITDWDSTYLPDEISYVYSPSFDLRLFDDPAISFQYWRDFDSQRDGVTVQVSGNDGRTWVELGDNDLTSGVNWFTHQGVSAGPGETARYPEIAQNDIGVGFADAPRDNDGVAIVDEWIEARHALTVGGHLINNIRFRFALAAGGGNKFTAGQSGITSIADGFAFDDFRIFEKNKRVVVEQFSTSLLTASKTNEYYIQNGTTTDPAMAPFDHTIDWISGTQAVWINYYTDFYNDEVNNVVDQINARNKVDPATRATYYGITDVPTTRVAGKVVEYDMDVNPEDFGNGFDAISLESPDFLIPDADFTLDISDTDQLTGSVKFVSQIDRADEVELLFYIAVVEKRIPALSTDGVMNGLDDPNSAYTLPGDTLYHVLRKMLPGPAGNYYKGTLTQFQEFDVDFDWTISNVYNEDEMRVIAYVQYYNDEAEQEDSERRSIEQSNFIDLAGKTNVEVGVKEELALNGYDLYPNPADDMLNLQLKDIPNEDVYYRISDQSGREVMRGKIDRGSSNQSPQPIDTGDLPSGLYIIQLQSEDRNWTPKKVLVKH